MVLTSSALWILVKIVVIVILCLVLQKISKKIMFLWEISPAGRRINKSYTTILRSSVRILIIAIGIILVLQSIGIDLVPLIASFGVLSFAVSFALKDILSNVMAGILISVDPPFKVGDYIEYPGSKKVLRGRVEEIGVRFVKLRTDDGSVVILPNSQIIKKDIINYSTGYLYVDVEISAPSSEEAVKSIRERLEKICELGGVYVLDHKEGTFRVRIYYRNAREEEILSAIKS